MTKVFRHSDSFQPRHIGISTEQLPDMLELLGVDSLDQLIEETIPDSIRLNESMGLPEAMSEYEYTHWITGLAKKNELSKSYIGQGYYGTITPAPILRNIFQNPGWYTQYTPYQAEISQGRLEALLNFQTMVSELTGLPIANASLLDEGTAEAEAMAMLLDVANKRRKEDKRQRFFIDNGVYDYNVDVILSRAKSFEVEVVRGDWKTMQLDDSYFACLVQFPNAEGCVEDYRRFFEGNHEKEIYNIVAADLMSLVLLESPGSWGADVVVGNSQRFGVPMGFGGPHAAFFATKEDYKRLIPGRIIGVSLDRLEKQSLRMALQTREQHIKREKATSNICTAQALLAIMAGMYAVYHGAEGLKKIALRIHLMTASLANGLKALGFQLMHDSYFDTLCVELSSENMNQLKSVANAKKINFFYADDAVRISLDETCDGDDIATILKVFSELNDGKEIQAIADVSPAIPAGLERSTAVLSHPVFELYKTETELMRYIKGLENKDLSLMHSMIPLGSCTMKLNAASELIPVSLPEFSEVHPFTPADQVQGYLDMIRDLEMYLCKVTGFTACSLQPNSGAQGEFAGLLVIKAYHEDRGDDHRNITLIPSSAHGTNPASAVMAGTKVVVVPCDDQGNIIVEELRKKAEEHKDHLAALMVTYPSTHGVFETAIKEICEIIHQNGGLVYMDGANMNAQVGLTSPGIVGADVCHLNLHKTFAIPHGGGGPGMGPICVNDKLKPYLPGHRHQETGGEKAVKSVSSAPWGSASILLISYAYIRMLGETGCTDASKYAILNANYIKTRLEDHYQVLYTGELGRVAHELIIDLRPFKPAGISAEDVAKRLIDYGFHAPTLSFPVPGTIMIEPTESESLAELDLFCDAMLSIREEIDEVARGEMDEKDNVLTMAPHTAEELITNDWTHPYSREKAAYPLPYLREKHKFWPSTSRVNNAYGDRNLICVCPPIESYMDEA